MESRLIFLGSEKHIEEAFLLLACSDGRTEWRHYDFHEVEFDTALQLIVEEKERLGVPHCTATCAIAVVPEDFGL